VKQLINIYDNVISQHSVEVFRQERKKKGREKDARKYLTDRELKLTETGFDIYILLTIFSDEFDNPKLDSFKEHGMSADERDEYEALRKEHEGFKRDKIKKKKSSKSTSLNKKQSSKKSASSKARSKKSLLTFREE